MGGGRGGAAQRRAERNNERAELPEGPPGSNNKLLRALPGPPSPSLPPPSFRDFSEDSADWSPSVVMTKTVKIRGGHPTGRGCGAVRMFDATRIEHPSERRGGSVKHFELVFSTYILSN